MIFAVWRYRLGLVRYFDVDEYMYPNWAYHISVGYRPYIDFMMLVTPLYVLLNIPIFWFWNGTDPLIIGRVIAFIIFILLSGALMWLFWEMRRSWIAIIAGLILLVLPMPSDKFLEIRPDNLAISLFLFGLVCEMKWMTKNKKSWAFWSGILYSLSFLTLQKTLPYILIASIVGIIKNIYGTSRKQIFQLSITYFILGGLLALLPIIIWAFISGSPSIVFYSILKLPVEVSAMYKNLKLGLFYFRPIRAFYGQDGYGWGIIVNHSLWIIGISVATLRFFWSILSKKNQKIPELLLATLCLVSIGTYIIFPIQYPQYLIPAAVFICWYVADGIYLLWHALKRIRLQIIFIPIYILVCFILYKTFVYVNWPKIWWTNEADFARIRNILSSIPRHEYILDFDGRTLYYPYPYYVCCFHFGDFRHNLSRSFPSIKQALIKTKTKYIYTEPERIWGLSHDDLEYIEKNYVKSADEFLYVIKSH